MLEVSFGGGKWTIDRTPNDCPICHHAIDARFLAGVTLKSEPGGESLLDLVFQCPQKDCLRAFLGRYSGRFDIQASGHRYHLVATSPYTPLAPSHNELVAKMSPSFVSIYREANAAEVWKLGEIAGGGYRKALEFLVKDYCASEEPAEAASIRAKLLGAVIAEHIQDENIKQCARRATWLGNDETHYERRWTNKDIQDLKALIALTESWVGTHLLTRKYLAEMPEPEPKK